ncbi:MAG: flagellar biosynthetic protein FliR [Rickettsiaceae bacterium]|nr:flagellar biosynthetic protein FliR [Rickettsiaceae bacterium]
MTVQLIFDFFLVLARISALFTMVPGLSDERISIKTRLGMSFAVTLCSVSFASQYLPPYTTSSSLLVYYMISEILIGMMLGLSLRILFSSILTLGNIVSMQSGLSAATMYDPSQKEQVAIFGSFVLTISLTMIFASDSHHLFIAGFLESYEKFRPGFMLDMSDMSLKITNTVNQAFNIAFKIAAPFIIVGTSILVGGGVLSRLMPTFQVFFVITPAQILIMFMVLYVVMNKIISIVIECLIGAF